MMLVFVGRMSMGTSSRAMSCIFNISSLPPCMYMDGGSGAGQLLPLASIIG